MSWKEKLRTLERQKEWDAAIELMIHTINHNPDDMDAYIYMNYLLMNLLVEEDHTSIDENKFAYYETLTKHYFDESYAKFSNNAEYLFFTATTAVMSEWFFGIDVPDYEAMFQKAMLLEPNNLLYQRIYYMDLDKTIPGNKKAAMEYAKKILDKDSPIQKTLKSKGAVGAYLLELMTNSSLEMLGMK